LVTTDDLRTRAGFGVRSGLRARGSLSGRGRRLYRSDYAAAAAGFERLAEAGDARAQHNIALVYLEGQGVAQDYAKAMLWYRKSAEQGFAPSQVDIAIMYEEGEGVPVDLDQAIAWYAKAAAQDFLPAEQKLVGLYFERQDYADALIWARKGVEQGDPGEQFNLGLFYFNGWAVPKDEAQARQWYMKAAAQGFEPAIAALKKMK
jgi:TPR repeat protein